MPRPVRVHVQGAICYVTSQANEGSTLFRDARDYEAYRALLFHYGEQFGFRLFAYTLLPSELHLVMELTNGTTISTIMHAINSRYTKHVATRYGHTGHLFQERFHMTLIEKAPSALRLTGFLHQLPQRRGATENLREYPWSSYLGYLAAAGSSIGPTTGGEVQEVFNRLQETHPGMSYEAYVQGLMSHDMDELELALEKSVIGSDDFLAMVAEKQKAAAQPAQAVRETVPVPAVASPQRAGRFPSLMLTASLSVAFLSLCTTLFYANGFSMLRKNVQVLAQERASSFFASALGRSGSPQASQARLTTFGALTTLAGTEWELHLRPMSGSAVATTDHVTFQTGTMTSDALSTEGFLPSRYTVIPQDDGTVVWETMQADRHGTIASWRGTWNGQTMHGVLTRQVPGQPAMNFGFVGSAAPQGPGQPTSEI